MTKKLGVSIASVLMMMVVAGAANAGTTGTEWDPAAALVENALRGPAGYVALLAAAAASAWGVIAKKMSAIISGIVVALAVVLGPSIIGGVVTATI